MKPDFTEIIFVLDRSGSMEPLAKDVIGGFNGIIENQRKLEGTAAVTLVLFDDEYEVVYSAKDINDVAPLTNKQYFARGLTALLDAVGKTIDDVGLRLSNTPEEERPSKVLIIINTDGFENASREYTKEKVCEMVTRQREKYSWEFLFLGADIDAFGTARELGISTANTAQYSHSPDGILLGCYAMDNFISSKRMKKSSKDWKKCLEENK